MTQTAPVEDWATDFDVLDPQYLTDPFSIWDELRQTCPIAAHRPAQEQLAADPLRGRHRDRARHRALQLAQGGGDPRRRGRGSRPNFDGPNLEYGLPPDLGGPAAAHLDPPAAAALVLAQAGRQLRAADP